MLSIYPNARGFAYALFEGVADPVDWGIKRQSNRKPSVYLATVRELLDVFEPRVLVLRDCHAPDAHCSKRTIPILTRIDQLAHAKSIAVHSYSRAQIRACFAPYKAQKKDAIARVIAKQFPEFAPRLPPFRKDWMSEDHRMGLFDALALIFTYYSKEQLRPRKP